MQPSAPRSELPRDGAVIGGDSGQPALEPAARCAALPAAARRRRAISTDLLRDRVVVGNDTALALPPGVYHWRVAAMAGGAPRPRSATVRSGRPRCSSCVPCRRCPSSSRCSSARRNLLLRWRPTAAGQGLQVQLASDPAVRAGRVRSAHLGCADAAAAPARRRVPPADAIVDRRCECRRIRSGATPRGTGRAVLGALVRRCSNASRPGPAGWGRRIGGCAA